MRRTLIAISVLFAIPAQAAESTALMCLFKPLTLRFNLVTVSGQDMIQWESSGFQAVVATVEEHYLTVRHYAPSATFKAVIDIETMQGYGGITTFNGEKSEGSIICAPD